MILRMVERPFSIVYLLNLSICDLLTGIIVIFAKVLDLVNSRRLDILYGIAIFSFLRLSLIMSSLSLIVITIDRYIGVILPFYYRRIKRRYAKYVCLCLWLFATVVMVIEKIIMTVIPERNHLYLDLIFPIFIFPTSCIIGFGYSSIVQKIRQTKSDLQRSSSAMGPSSTVVIRGRKLNDFNREEQLARLLVAIIIVYVVCWFPIAITVICTLAETHETAANHYVYSFDICICITLLNSCLNPIIYFNHIRRNLSGFVHQVKRRMSSVIWKETSVVENFYIVNEIIDGQTRQTGLSNQLSTKL